MEDTYPKLLLRNVERGADGVALRKKNRGVWQEYTWANCHEKTRAICLGLLDLGLLPGETVCILGEGNPEWFWTELAAQAARGVVAGIDPAWPGDQTRDAIALSQARFVFAQDQEQVDRVLEVRDALPLLQRVIFWRGKGLQNYDDPLLLSLDGLMRSGRDRDKAAAGEFERRVEEGQKTDPGLLLFAGERKWASKVMPVTHEFLISSATAALTSSGVSSRDDYVSTVPPGCFLEQVLGFGACLLAGQKLDFAETSGTFWADSREISPQVIIHPSQTWESLVQNIQKNMTAGNWLKRALYHRSLSLGYRRADLSGRGSRPGPGGRIINGIASALALQALRDKHGLNKVKIAYAAGGVLSGDASRYLGAIGIDIRLVFGSARDGVVPAPPPPEVSI